MKPDRIEQIIHLKNHIRKIDDIIESLEDAFVWHYNSKGFEYWDDVRNNLRAVRDKFALKIQALNEDEK